MEERDFERIARYFIPDWIQWHEECREQVLIAMRGVFDEVLSEMDERDVMRNYTIISRRRRDGMMLKRKDSAASIVRMAYFQKAIWSIEDVAAIYSDDQYDLTVFNPKIGQIITDCLTGEKWKVSTIDWQNKEIVCVNEKNEVQRFNADRLSV